VKVLVYASDVGIIGGSQINAIDLAATVAAAGHDVQVFGMEGILTPYILEKGLEFIPARRLRYRPAPSRVTQLFTLARRERIDLIHAYEWPACLDAYFGANLTGGVPLLCTVLSMEVPSLIPNSVPLVLGTEKLAAQARKTRCNVSVVEPPIDVDGDHPSIDGTEFRRTHHVADDEILVVTVSRLAVELKLGALVDAMDAVGNLAQSHRVRLIIVGDGEARPQLEARAVEINNRFSREVVSLVGSTLNPRPAYAAADIVVGMGSSALRALAIGRPVVVQGERGFSLPFTPKNLNIFLWQGFWGMGDGDPGGRQLEANLLPFVADGAMRERLGAYGRGIVVNRFSVSKAAAKIEKLYEATIQDTDGRRWRAGEAASTAFGALRIEYEAHLPSNKRARSIDRNIRLASASERATYT
jgi:glycosyltransferase involved in cell wall biosynthesis